MILTRLDDLARHLLATQGGDRRLVALAGAPGSGKSVAAATLASRIDDAAPGSAAVLAMDGFHLDDSVLSARGDLARKGAPHTFDTGGFAATLRRLRADDGEDVVAPAFDRALEIARAGAVVIGASVRTVFVEGNYLLLARPPWQALRALFDLTVWLDVPRPVLEQRLLARWANHGLDAAAARVKLAYNDLPNAELVCACRAPADLVLAPPC